MDKKSKAKTASVFSVIQTPVVLVLFFVQLAILTLSIQSFMGGDKSNLWLAAVVSIMLMVPAIICASLRAR